MSIIVTDKKAISNWQPDEKPKKAVSKNDAKNNAKNDAAPTPATPDNAEGDSDVEDATNDAEPEMVITKKKK